jgi:hypothetical protein
MRFRSLFFQIAPLKGARKAELSGKITDFERACSKAFGTSRPKGRSSATKLASHSARARSTSVPPGAFEIGDFPAQDEPFRGAI